VVGTLKLYLRMPDSMKKESAQSDNSGLRSVHNVDILTYSGCRSYHPFLDVFSALDDRIELIPFALSQAP
jgi:hypothetical protein